MAAFASEANLAAVAERGVEPYRPPGRSKHGDDHEGGTRDVKKRPRLNMVDSARSSRRAASASSRLRLEKVRGEWAILCTVHTPLTPAGTTAKAKVAAA